MTMAHGSDHGSDHGPCMMGRLYFLACVYISGLYAVSSKILLNKSVTQVPPLYTLRELWHCNKTCPSHGILKYSSTS